jgi:hypothetical protein
VRIVTTLLATLLSLLLVSTPVLTSACDLSCRLRQESECHTVGAAAPGSRNLAMDMSCDMDMSLGHNESMIGHSVASTMDMGAPIYNENIMAADATMDDAAVSVLMSAQLEIMIERLDEATKCEVSKWGMFHRFPTNSSRAREACRQIWASMFPSSSVGWLSQHKSPGVIATVNSGSFPLRVGFQQMKLRPPPSNFFSSDPLFTALRI